MSDNFAPPPPGPPPTAAPQVPEGFKAHWNDQYKEWFYVNIYTKKSQWEKPKEPAYPDGESAPPGPPPSYTSDNKEHTDIKQNTDTRPEGKSNESDAETAARLQQQENRGIMDMASGMAQQSLPSREQKPKQGFLGKLLGKSNSGSTNNSQSNVPQPPYAQQPQYGYPQAQQYNAYPPPQQSYPPQGYPPQGYPPQGYPPQGYPPQGYPPQGYPPQGYPPQGYPPQGYPPQGYPPQGYGQPSYGAGAGAVSKYPTSAKAKTGGAGLGMAGGAALGLGAGLVGGMLLEDAIESHDERIYEQGYEDAQDDDGDFGGDDDF